MYENQNYSKFYHKPVCFNCLGDSDYFDYLCMFHQSVKICSKPYNCIIFRLIFIYLIDIGTDFCWLIPRHTKGYSVW